MNYDNMTAKEKRAFDKGFHEGESKQAILEVQAQSRFVASFRQKVNAAVNEKLAAAREELEDI